VSIDQATLNATRTLAFLFTDIEGSTRLWEQHPEAMRASLAQHDHIVDAAIGGAHGHVIKTTGDGVMAVFGTARDGVAACIDAQSALQRAAWGETGPLRVRMGLHVGEGQGDGQDFHGPAVNRAARIMAAGHGGQILLSGSTAALVIDGLPEGTSLRDLGEHLLKDLARPERVYQLDYPAMPEAFMPLTTVDVRTASLPAEPSLFVGRETERQAIAERLADPAVRLLTLTGPGGIGKTRLALRAALDVEHSFAAGAGFVDLSVARDTSAVLSTIARELGFTDASEEAQLGELVTRVGRQELLLLLDNVEQVTMAAPTLAQLLQGCPQLKLLITSREPLRVRGEHLFAVPPLAVPALGRERPSARQLEQFEAVLLFVERARAVRPDFSVSDDNAAVVADICRRLEGLPLAIELATARLRVFSLEALRDRLGIGLKALGSGARDLPERQQTLRATIDWSFQLLESAEQRLFVVMACFAGAHIEAVESVVSAVGPQLADVDPVEGLISLTDKSLLRQSEVEGQAPRFEMLESVREFALEVLDQDGDLARQVRAAHAAYYAQWAAAHGSEITGPERSDVLRQLESELENLRSAWRCAVGQRDLGQLEALLSGLGPLYDARGWYRAFIDLGDEALAVLESLDRSNEGDVLAVILRSNQARALTAMQGYTEEVEAAYERLLASLEGADVPQVYPVLCGLATLYTFRADHERATELARELLRLAERQADPEIRVVGHLMLGTGLSFAGRIPDGLPELEAGVRFFEEHDYDASRFSLGPDPRVSTWTALSLLQWWQGRLDTSTQRSDAALAMARRLDHPSTTGYALYHAALLRLWRNEPAEARELAVRVIEVAAEYELHIWKAVGTVIVGASAVALGTGDEGLRWVSEGLERYRGLRTPPIFWPFLLLVRAEACARAGRDTEGLASADEALALAPFLPDLHVVRGDLLHAAGAMDEATASWERALETAHGWGAATPELRAALRLCALQPATDPLRRDAWLGALRDVRATFSEGLDAPEIAQADTLLGSSD